MVIFTVSPPGYPWILFYICLTIDQNLGKINSLDIFKNFD